MYSPFRTGEGGALLQLGDFLKCGLESNDCCFKYLDLQLIEVIYLNNALNRTLNSKLRLELIHRAVDVNKITKKISRRPTENADGTDNGKKALAEIYVLEKILCPLNRESKCVLFNYRPIQCRLYGIPDGAIAADLVNKTLLDISRNVSFAFSGFFLEDTTL